MCKHLNGGTNVHTLLRRSTQLSPDRPSRMKVYSQMAVCYVATGSVGAQSRYLGRCGGELQYAPRWSLQEELAPRCSCVFTIYSPLRVVNSSETNRTLTVCRWLEFDDGFYYRYVPLLIFVLFSAIFISSSPLCI